MNFNYENPFDTNDEREDELDYDTAYDFNGDDLESDDERFGGSLEFCSPLFREIFGKDR